MLDPGELYELEPDVPELDGAVLVHGLSGFVDAGSSTRLAIEHLRTTLDSRVIARFDADQLIDYRSRRPRIAFDQDHYTGYQQPVIEVVLLHDEDGTPFLILDGREPDVQWDRFVSGVIDLFEAWNVGLAVELHAIPMAVPHTRPVAFTTHGNRTDLIAGERSWKHSVLIPASVGSLLELRLTERGHDTFGLAVHVPYYLAESEYATAAAAMVDSLAKATGLALPSAALHEAAEQARVQIDEQTSSSTEVAQVVTQLEQQYDAYTAEESNRADLLEAAGGELPTGDELAESFERFLAEHERKDTGDNPD